VLANAETWTLGIIGSAVTLILGILSVMVQKTKAQNSAEHGSTVNKIDNNGDILKSLSTRFDVFIEKDHADKKAISSNLDTLHTAVHEITMHLLREKEKK
jgi:hypothetical protein